jgi:hypothetical protein
MSKNLKIILQNLISRSQSKPHHQADLMAALQTPTLTPEDWRAAFDAQGATLALDQNIHSSPMVRLLTLQALILPETLPRFVTWMLADPSGPQNQNSQRLSLEFQSSFVAAWIPTHQETLQPALTAGIARLLEKVVQKTWPPESLLWLLASPQSLWRFAELAQHLHQDLYTLTTTPPPLTDSPESSLVYAGALWRPLQAWLPTQTAPRPKRYGALAQLCEQISLAWETSHPTEASHLLTLAIYFYQVSSGSVAPSLMAKAQLPDHQRQHLYGVDLPNPPSSSPPSAPSPPLPSSGSAPPSSEEYIQQGSQLSFDAPYIEPPQRLKELAKKNIWIAGFLTLCLTPVGYLYTGRKQLALLILLFWLPLMLTSEENDAMSFLAGLLLFGATIENVMAIQKAREAIKKDDFSPDQDSEVSELSIELLKLAQEKSEITMVDCVIKTGKTPEELLKALIELEHHNLLRSGNRESDGVIIYRIV